MNQVTKTAKSAREPAAIILNVAVILLLVYNGIYWTGKFAPSFLDGITSLRLALIAHWGLITFLEFLAVASLFVDLVIKWDTFKPAHRTWRLLLTGLILSAFITRFILGVIDLYMIGEIQ